MLDFIFSLLSFSICLVTCINVFFIIKGEIISGSLFRAYLVAAIAVIFWNFGYTLMFNTHDKSLVAKFYMLASLGWAIVPSTSMYFIYQLHNNFIQKKSSMALSVLMFLPCPIFLYKAFQGNFLVHDFSRVSSGWIESINFESYWIVLYFFISMSAYIFSIVLLLKLIFNSKLNKHRMQAKLIVIPVSVAASLTLVSNLLLPALDMPRMPPLGHVILGSWILFIGYSIIKYPVLAITPKFIVDDLLINMYDVVIVADTNGEIIFANQAISLILGYDPDELSGTHVTKLIEGGIKSVVKKGEISDKHILELNFITRNEGLIPCSCVISLMKDAFNDPVGYLLFAHDIRDLKNLEKLTEQLKEHQEALQGNFEIIEDKNEVMERELYLARHIQRSLIPEPIDDIQGVSFHAIYKPMMDVGGDLYDFIRFNEKNRVGIFISDVSGHGVGAALIGSMTKTLINTVGNQKYSPVEFMEYINTSMIGQTNMNFITAVYGIYDDGSKTLTYSRCGHPYPFLIRDNVISELKSKGPLLGIIKKMNIEEETIELKKGDKIVFYTDGLLETVNEKKQSFEKYGLTDILHKFSQNNIKDYIDAIYRHLKEFRGDEAFDDDVCIVGMEIE